MLLASLLLQRSAGEITIASVSPSTVIAGDVAFWLTVNGSGFDRDSVVRLDGVSRTTTFLSPTKIAASIVAGDISSAGTRQVSVHSTTGGQSHSLPLTIVAPPPAPKMNSISPATIAAGGSEFRLTVTGTDFVAASLIEIDGVTYPTFDGTATRLTAVLPASERATAGTRRIRIVTPAPGGGASEYAELTILPKQPAVVAVASRLRRGPRAQSQ